MKHAAHKTTVGTLRRFIDQEMKLAGRPERFSQEELARLIEKTPATIASLESGRLALSEETAKLISDRTGISLLWLLNGKPAASMRESIGLYTKEVREAEAADYWNENEEILQQKRDEHGKPVGPIYKERLVREEVPEKAPSSIRPYTLQSFDRASFNRAKREEPYGLARTSIVIGFDRIGVEIKEFSSQCCKSPDAEFWLWKMSRAVQLIRDEFNSNP